MVLRALKAHTSTQRAYKALRGAHFHPAGALPGEALFTATAYAYRVKKRRVTYPCLEARRAGSPNISPAREGWVQIRDDAERRTRDTPSRLSDLLYGSTRVVP